MHFKSTSVTIPMASVWTPNERKLTSLTQIIQAEVAKAVAPLKKKIEELSKKPPAPVTKPKPVPPEKFKTEEFKCQSKPQTFKAPPNAKWVAFTLEGGAGGLNYVGNPGSYLNYTLLQRTVVIPHIQWHIPRIQ